MSGRRPPISITAFWITTAMPSAESIGAKYPKYADAIAQAARESFLVGQNWAYLAGVLAGAALVCFVYPNLQRERALIDIVGQGVFQQGLSALKTHFRR